MRGHQVEERTEQLVRKLLESQDGGEKIELVDVEYVKEHDWYLRVFIDKEGSIGLEDCQALSEKIEAALDKEDFPPDSYVLEVSSPGIDRILKKPRDFEREQGKRVDVSLYAPLDGKKLVTGVLTGYDGKSIMLDEKTQIPLEDAAQVRLHVDF